MVEIKHAKGIKTSWLAWKSCSRYQCIDGGRLLLPLHVDTFLITPVNPHVYRL